ncbi:uncharacterized protein OCT59_001591 [Rhizophagus irregularis]|uniref:uncharacterized protein n=1 Tax=Rhizophagus irregularis TaxID=588596 RepID=UPI0033202377|nr:hypothetical protein OCT59_001591 [Rhizophagus irregularis]
MNNSFEMSNYPKSFIRVHFHGTCNFISKVNALDLLWLGNWQRWLWCELGTIATEINLTDGRFAEEKKCDVDKRIMSEENEMTMSSIDNPPTNIIDDDNANDMNIRTRKRSREILLDHYFSCQVV